MIVRVEDCIRLRGRGQVRGRLVKLVVHAGMLYNGDQGMLCANLSAALSLIEFFYTFLGFRFAHRFAPPHAGYLPGVPSALNEDATFTFQQNGRVDP